MFRKTLFASLLAATAMTLSVTPAEASRGDRAREAIAAAEAKIQSAETLGAGTAMPAQAADARATLARAKERLKRGDSSESIDLAIEAQAMADAAVGILNRDKERQLAAANAASNANAQEALAAQQQAAAAQNQAAAAQNQALDANARASVAERSAAAAAAEAQAARTAAQQPAEVETTVTTGAGTATRPTTRVKRKTTTRRTTTAPAATTTTTTVRQAVD